MVNNSLSPQNQIVPETVLGLFAKILADLAEFVDGRTQVEFGQVLAEMVN